MDGGEPITLGRLTGYALLTVRNLRPYAMPLKHFARIKLHDAFIDRVRQRRSDVGSNKVVDPGYLLRVSLCDHDLQLVVHVVALFPLDASSIALPQVSAID